MLHAFTRSQLNLEKKARKHFQGSNHGNSIAPVALPAWKDVWRVSPELKKKIYGKGGKVAVGGCSPEPITQKPSFEDGKEPVCWHSPGERLYEEILSSFNGKLLVDLTTNDTQAAMACLRNKTNYVGVCMTDTHRSVFHAALVTQVWEQMKDENSPLYQAGLAELLVPSTEHPEEPQLGNKKNPKNNKIDDQEPPQKKQKKGKAGGPAPAPKSGGKKQTKKELLAVLAALQGSPGGASGGGEPVEESDDSVEE